MEPGAEEDLREEEEESPGAWGAADTLDGPTWAPTRRAADAVSVPAPVDARRPQGAVTPEAEGRYDPDVRELGRGGIGRVLAVYDRHLGRRVAIKELLPSSEAGEIAESDLIRFLREARVTGQLEHPNIVPVYELGQRSDGTLFYSMKIVRGRTLRQALKGAETLADRLRLLPHYVDLANAIAYAHSRGVVHRDIKPDNVMLGEFGETIVLDWGLTKVRGEPEDVAVGATVRRQRALLDSDTDSATRAGDVLGTPAYMSPEQAAGDIGRVDERSDVWSLGAVLFEMLTGQPPFRGSKPMEMLWRVAEGDVPRVSDFEPAAPRDLAAVAQKAMRRRRADRYPDATSLVADVEAFMTGQRVGAYDYTALELLRKFIVEHRAAATAVFAIALVVLVGGILTFAAYQRALVEQERARVAEQLALEAKATSEANERRASDNLSTALFEKAKLLCDEKDYGTAGVYAAGALVHSPWVPSSPSAYPDLEDRDPRERAERRLPLRSVMYEALTGTVLERQLTLSTPEVCGLDLSDDGRWILASSVDGRVTLWDLESRAPAFRVDAPDCPRYLDIDPLSRWAVFTDVEGPVTLLDLDQRTTRVLSPDDREAWMLAFSPRGRALAVARSDGSVVRYDVGSWTIQARGRVEDPRSIAFSPDGERVAIGTRWGRVVLLEAGSLRPRARFEDHGSTVYAVRFSPDGRRLASAGFEGAIVIRSLEGSASPTRLPGTKVIRDLAWLGDRVVSTGVEQARLWSIEDAWVQQIVRRPPAVRTVRAGPDGRTVVTAGFRENIDVWRLGDGPGWRAPHEGPLFAVARSDDGRWVATVDDTERVWWWDATNQSLVWSAQEPTVWAVAFAGERLLSLSSRGRVRAWSREGDSRVLQPEIAARQDSHVGIDVSASGRWAAWTAAEDEIVIYDLAADRVRARLRGLESQSTSVVFSPDERWVAAGSYEGGLGMWDLESHEQVWLDPSAHDGVISGLAFAADGATVLSSGRDGRIRRWTAASGAPRPELIGHRGWVNQVAVSPDGRYVLSGSDDGTARLWDAERRLPLLELRSTEHVTAVAFDPGRDAMLVGLDHALRRLPLHLPLLDEPAPRLLEHAQDVAGARLDGFALIPNEH